jgi:sugar-specific transcriptional regulator TrmB
MNNLSLPESLLNSNQISVYIASLELGSDTVAHISEKTGLPRSSTYLIVDELIKKGLLSTTKVNRKPLISAEPPNKLLDLIKTHQAQLTESLTLLNNILPTLEAINNRRSDKPSIAFYSGFEGIKSILQKSLDTKEILVICSGYDKPVDKQTADYLDNEYFPNTNRLHIKTWEILGNAPDLDSYMNKFNSQFHQIKKLPRTQSDTHIDKLIFGNTVAIVSYDTLNGTVVTHQEIALFERRLFYQIWETLK